jgi:hypothetical protein
LNKQLRKMKITVEVNGKPVEIELTKDQITKVKKHTDKITDRIKTWADVLEYHGISATQFNESYNSLDQQGFANAQVKLIALALNEGVVMDSFNESQYKYYPYFYVNSGAFVSGGYNYWRGTTDVGSRLCFVSSELAIYAGKTFIDIYTKLLS